LDLQKNDPRKCNRRVIFRKDGLARIEKLLLAEQTHPPETLTVEIVCRKRAQTDVWHICVDCTAWPTWNYTEKWLELASVDPDTICIQCFQRRREGKCRICNPRTFYDLGSWLFAICLHGAGSLARVQSPPSEKSFPNWPRASHIRFDACHIRDCSVSSLGKIGEGNAGRTFLFVHCFVHRSLANPACYWVD
jgi:hypothetical protein